YHHQQKNQISIGQGNKTNLDIFWIKDNSLKGIDNLPEPDAIANEIIDELQNALEQLQEIAGNLGD
ncbi:unnamed protein product, partial [marine sediment metagenome]